MMATQGVELPQIEVFNRVLGLPLVESALAKSAVTYSRVKGFNQLFSWVLSTAESSLSIATKQAVPIAAPIAKKFETPIQYFDQKLCLGLDKIEESVPIVKETPNQILENAYMLALQSTISTISFANDFFNTQTTNLKDRSWNSINQILGTHYGTVAIHGLDNTVIVVNKLLDKYFPATETEEDTAPTSIEEDKLMHTLQTVGQLSNKATRRVYSNIIKNLRTINKDSLKTYLSSVIEFSQLANYLQAVNKKVHKLTGPAMNGVKKTKSS